jgi:integrase
VQLRRESGLRDRALIVTALPDRPADLRGAGLRLHDVDLERGTLRVRGTKTRTSDRTVGIDRMTAAHVRDWIDVRSTLGIPKTSATSSAASPATSAATRSSRRRRGRSSTGSREGRDLRSASIRTGCGTRSLPSSPTRRVDMRVVQNALGHSNIAITDRYISHLNPTAVLSFMGART